MQRASAASSRYKPSSMIAIDRKGAGLFLRAYRLGSLALLAASFAIVLMVAGGFQLPVLSLRSPVTRHVSVAALLPLASALAICGRSDPGLGELEKAWASRPAGRRFSFLIVAEAIICLPVLGLLVSPAADLLPQVLRNIAGLSGLGILAAVAGGAVWGWAAPTSYCLAALTLGERSDGHPAAWAWLLDQRFGLWGSLAGIALLVVGSAAFIVLGPRQFKGKALA